MLGALDAVSEAQYVCVVAGRKVVKMWPVGDVALPEGSYPVEVEIMDRRRSYGIFQGEVRGGRPSVGKDALSSLADGSYLCVFYVPRRHSWAAEGAVPQ